VRRSAELEGRVATPTGRWLSCLRVVASLTSESNSQDLWIGVLRDLLIASCFVGSFDEFAVDEGRASTDESDQVGCVHRAPAGLGGLHELERHRDPGGPRAGAFGDALSQPDGGEGRLDAYLELRW